MYNNYLHSVHRHELYTERDQIVGLMFTALLWAGSMWCMSSLWHAGMVSDHAVFTMQLLIRDAVFSTHCQIYCSEVLVQQAEHI